MPKNTSIRASVKPAAFVLFLFLFQGCQTSLTPGQMQMTEPAQSRFTQISMTDFMNVTSPPRGLSESQTEQSSATNMTAPPRGMTAPPIGFTTSFERSHFARFDLNGDSHWDHSELSAYVGEWQAQRQTSAGFIAKAGLTLDVESLIDTYDRNHDRLLDYEEARTLHLGLAQTLSAGPLTD